LYYIKPAVKINRVILMNLTLNQKTQVKRLILLKISLSCNRKGLFKFKYINLINYETYNINYQSYNTER